MNISIDTYRRAGWTNSPPRGLAVACRPLTGRVSRQTASADIGSHDAARRPDAAFTMIEIALCLGILGFALAAIMGVLPSGMRVQQSNRNDTIVNQDATFFLDAIRNSTTNGSTGFDMLANYVDEIWITNKINPTGLGYKDFTRFGTNSGKVILGLLSTPQWTRASTSSSWITNIVVAKIRAISGSVAEHNVLTRDVAFKYQMRVEITPNPIPANPFTDAQSYYLLGTNLYNLRLTFRWPIRPDGVAGDGFQIYRASVNTGPMDVMEITNNGVVMQTNNWRKPIYFFRPNYFTLQ